MLEVAAMEGKYIYGGYTPWGSLSHVIAFQERCTSSMMIKLGHFNTLVSLEILNV